MTNSKAEFSNLYASYSSTGYVNHLVKGLKYELPFLAMQKLKQYCAKLLPQDKIRVTILGSAHGLDAVALKHNCTPKEITERWTNEETLSLPFEKSNAPYEVTLVDREKEPLRFASDVQLANHSFVADLNKTYPPLLAQHLVNSTDVISAIGVTSYMGAVGFEKLMQTAFGEGSTPIFYFSILKYLETDAYLEVLSKYGLIVRHVADVQQRYYEDDKEKQRIHKVLKERGKFTEGDKEGLETSIFIAYKEASFLGTPNTKTQTLVVNNLENTLIGHKEMDTFQDINQWTHPWHIALSKEDAENKEVLNQLTQLHIKGAIQTGDVITAPTSTSIPNLGAWANMFMGEYEVEKQVVKDGSIKQVLRKVSPTINANILTQAPNSSEELEIQLREFGHALIRSKTPIDDENILSLINRDGKKMSYQYGNTKREQLKNSPSIQVTPWPKEHNILPHSELSYHTEFPHKIAFLCKKPALFGGETSIYDCAKAFELLASDFQQKILKNNVIFYKRYVRATNHQRYPSWQQVLGKDASGQDVIAHFNSIGYKAELLQLEEDGELITVVETGLTRPIAYKHQNRICLHSSIVGISPFWYKTVWPDKEPPLRATWEHGAAFSLEELQQMENALLSARIFYNNWQENDALILDNLRIAHGRLPFEGERSIGVLMASPLQFVYTENKDWEVVATKQIQSEPETSLI